MLGHLSDSEAVIRLRNHAILNVSGTKILDIRKIELGNNIVNIGDFQSTLSCPNSNVLELKWFKG